MLQFTYLDKSKKEQFLPALFDLFYENMQNIASSGLTYQQEKEQWLKEVSPALEKDPRQILLCYDGDALTGYVQYYTNKDLLMIEEMQFVKAYQRTTLFYSLCKYFAKILPEEITRVEAYAHPQNHHSRKIMEKLGMTEQEEGAFIHLTGSATAIKGKMK